MSKLTRRGAMAGLAALGLAGKASAAALGVGDKAPDFSLPSSKGGTEKLSAYKGKKTVVAAFYPKAFTGG